jgi:hypothetical protein
LGTPNCSGRKSEHKKNDVGVVMILFIFVHKGQTEIASDSESLTKKKTGKKKTLFFSFFFFFLASE